jgi:hypothetical protein
VCERPLCATSGRSPKVSIPGTSSVDRNPNFGFRLAGASHIGALDSARNGLAFGIEEIDDGICRLADRTNDGYESKIECLVERYRFDAAVLACAGAFIDLLWGNAQLDHPRSRRLLKSVLCLAEAGRDIERIRRKPHEEVLKEVISMADQVALQEFSSEICCATDIMRRLDLLCPTPLAEEDDAALWRLGYANKPQGLGFDLVRFAGKSALCGPARTSAEGEALQRLRCLPARPSEVGRNCDGITCVGGQSIDRGGMVGAISC